MKRTPLYEMQKSVGATFETRMVSGTEAAWEVASVFSGVKKEYAAVRNAVGLFDLSQRGKIEITGPDRVRYLNGQVTNDVKKLSTGEGCYACILNPKGALVGDLKIYATEDCLFIDTAETCTQKIIDHLSRFAISDEVEILDRTPDIAHLAVHGPKSAVLLSELMGTDVSTLSEYSHKELCVSGLNVHLARQSYTGEFGFDLFTENKNVGTLWNEISAKGERLGLAWIGARALNVLRLEAGVPVFGIDMTEEHLVLEANLLSAISTTKGCYIGQEVVARVINRGHVNRLLVGLRISGSNPPAIGAKIFKGDKEVGQITSAEFSPTLDQIIALGYVPVLESQPETVFSIGDPNGSEQAEVTPLPFLKRM